LVLVRIRQNVFLPPYVRMIGRVLAGGGGEERQSSLWPGA